MRREPAARFIVIKPTLACTANCPTCSLRRLLHADASKEAALGLDDWRQVLEDAAALGAMRLTISGGEPTLYGHLAELIRAGKRLGLRVRVNSNGSLITEAYARSLLDAGLDVLCISLYATSPERMSAMRGNPVLWRKATEAIRILAALERDYPAFEVRSQTILSRENLADFPALLELHASLGSRQLTVSYLEGDFEGKYLPDGKEIQRFRAEAVPAALGACRAQGLVVGALARSSIRRLFSPNVLSPDDWASGRYWSRQLACAVPSHQALILANGDVHPCNIVEYAHEPVVGNVLRQPLAEIWNGTAWRDFRVGRHERCSQCPINRHTSIPLRPRRLTDAIYSAVFFDKAHARRTYELMGLQRAVAKSLRPRSD